MDLEANAVPEPAKLLADTSGLLSDDFGPINFSTSELLLSPLESLLFFSLGKMHCDLR